MMRTLEHNNPVIGILGTAQGPHVQALAGALEKRGARIILIDPKKLTSYLPEPVTLQAGNAAVRIGDLDALLVRSLPGGSLEQVIYRVNVLHRLEKLGLKVINSPSLIEKTVDKFYTSALLAAAGLPVPRTVVTERFAEALETVRAWGAVVVKPLFGSLGKGMVLIEDLDVAHRVFRALELGRYVYYLQEYLPNGNEDIRIFVLDGRVISAMRRRGKNWKTNIACGAIAEYFQPEPALCSLALRTAEVLKADYAGIDILLSRGQPYILEANGIPGWTGLQSVTSTDIADVLSQYVLKKIRNE